MYKDNTRRTNSSKYCYSGALQRTYASAICVISHCRLHQPWTNSALSGVQDGLILCFCRRGTNNSITIKAPVSSPSQADHGCLDRLTCRWLFVGAGLPRHTNARPQRRTCLGSQRSPMTSFPRILHLFPRRLCPLPPCPADPASRLNGIRLGPLQDPYHEWIPPRPASISRRS